MNEYTGEIISVTSKSKRIGDEFENWTVKKLRELGLDAGRTYLAAQAGREVHGDIRIGNILKAECKKSKNGSGFRMLYKWIKNVDFLFLRQTHQKPIVAMTWDMFEDLVKLYVEKINENQL